MPHPLFPAYEKLWRLAQSERAYVRYYDSPSGYGEAGFFKHDEKYPIKYPGFETRPTIGVRRPNAPAPEYEPSDSRTDGEPLDLAFELVTLAHEYGHFRSFLRGDPWQPYHAAQVHRDAIIKAEDDAERSDRAQWRVALDAGLSADEKRLIIEEEELAWMLGRPQVPAEVHALFDRRWREEVQVHRHFMCLDEPLAKPVSS